MTNNQRFYKLLEDPALDNIRGFWTDINHDTDRDGVVIPELDIERARQAFGMLSSGECHMLRFLAGVWLGSDEFEFDLIEAVRVLDDPLFAIIQRWIADPFYP